MLVPLGIVGHGYVWPFPPLTLRLSYGLFKCGLIRRGSCGTCLGRKAPVTFLIRRKRRLGSDPLTEAFLIPVISNFPLTITRLSFQHRCRVVVAGSLLDRLFNTSANPTLSPVG